VAEEIRDEKLGEHPMLAELTDGVLTQRHWSLQQAENYTRVKKGTIHNMRIGRNVDAEHLIRFAIAIGDDPNKWLKAAGKDFTLPIAAGLSPEPTAEEIQAAPQQVVVKPPVFVDERGREWELVAREGDPNAPIVLTEKEAALLSAFDLIKEIPRQEGTKKTY
jgi:hypothetical protein